MSAMGQERAFPLPQSRHPIPFFGTQQSRKSGVSNRQRLQAKTSATDRLKTTDLSPSV